VYINSPNTAIDTAIPNPTENGTITAGDVMRRSAELMELLLSSAGDTIAEDMDGVIRAVPVELAVSEIVGVIGGVGSGLERGSRENEVVETPVPMDTIVEVGICVAPELIVIGSSLAEFVELKLGVVETLIELVPDSV
jgi:hypothetical protein